jgi:rubrerythrin
MKMGLNDIFERIRKTNDQRAKMAYTLVGVMKHSEHCSIQMRSTVAASMIEMLDSCMIDEDNDLIKLLNDAINEVCEDAKEHGVDDLRSMLQQTIKTANEVLKEKLNRVKEGDDILSKMNFDNNINLN